MKLIRSVKEMQEAAAEAKRGGRRIGLVPTMGALHEGHAALIRKTREQGAAVVVSIYVNPTQFGPREDFKQYPRDLDKDCTLCVRESVDVVFAPFDAEMYEGGAHSQQASTWVDEITLAKRLEGERRPAYFRGVCTVVAKLFNATQPHLAVFGQKDYQQLKVIQRLVRDLCYPIQIVSVPIMREPDGLAVSSRNQYLNTEERAQATVLHKALNVALDLFNEGERNAHRLETAMVRAVQLAPAARLDYAEIAEAETLQPVHEVRRGNIALLAVLIGKTRLIDNLFL
ncbi:MAG TPA: pantoate--beta-alanine ligase [Verrucomicrobiae bacterium]|nr:pantoate--beta-alanine ligase [Verrucomicrobiae bacterium]